MSLEKYDLIIFDCDGTLVDSEYLNNQVAAEVLTDFGLDGYTPEKCVHDFAGRDWTTIKSIIDERHKIDLPYFVIDNFITTLQKRMETEFKTVQGSFGFVDQVAKDYKVCVGSNGERGSVIKSIVLGGFDKFFSEGNIFTKIQVEKAKPAPDLFFFAAEKMGVEPSKCLVIEDSVSGSAAGVAAGMDVIGFTGVSHDKNKAESDLEQVGCIAIYDDFIHIAEHLGY